MFVPLGIEQFVTPVFTGNTWNYVPSNLRKAPKRGARKNRAGLR
jgi:hypothetical protein